MVDDGEIDNNDYLEDANCLSEQDIMGESHNYFLTKKKDQVNMLTCQHGTTLAPAALIRKLKSDAVKTSSRK